jgi:lipoprotein-anchoring transpeptidase ErfK/SrfK
VRRPGIAALVLSGCLVAGALSSLALTASGAASPGQTSTGSTTTTTTPEPLLLAAGVTIGGVPVGGLTPEEAYVAVRASFEAALVLRLGRERFAISPEALGVVAYALAAVERAKRAAPNSAVPLEIAVNGRRVRAYVASLARRYDRVAVDSRLILRNLVPWISKGRVGRSLDRPAATKAISTALAANRKGPLRLATRVLKPRVGRQSFGPVIVIRRGSNRLHLYQGMRPWRVFGVATGQSTYPTPLGRFSIVVKWKHPWWYPPDSDWARGQEPIPPGPGNPLGTRWMGLSAGQVGIHGTPDAASIGYSVSHGCIRMRIPDAEWLFERVRVGTTVFIVSA